MYICLLKQFLNIGLKFSLWQMKCNCCEETNGGVSYRDITIAVVLLIFHLKQAQSEIFVLRYS